ncbi:metallophosphoesterase [Emticicia sp. TH156]|uniref:metallophosphoesterase n=1 Tax=Emticicia sp. TH156 TaxID=2067454 RepID=UPI000C78190F|nr:metallophosphoesterase [Emticicia sp. TH156]PLK44111.1 metallophosphatase [Emticicia sp. TH156]
MNKIAGQVIMAVVFVLIDLYVWQAVRLLMRSTSEMTQKVIGIGYWGLTIFSIAGLFVVFNYTPATAPVRASFRTFLMAGIFIFYISKIFSVLVLFIDDIIRLLKWVVSFFQSSPPQPATVAQNLEPVATGISRSDFLAKSALALGGLHMGGMTWGILSGAHDYHVRKVTLNLKNLPKQFDGMRIAQLSDIHSGSFFNKTAVKGGVEMLIKEKPDMFFFTGDLVNNIAPEVRDYIEIFSKIKAPLGTFSTLGNHDYGDYTQWVSAEKKRQNLNDLIEAHKTMGWDILLDEHREVKVDGEKLAVLGIQNWGAGGFSKYGNLEKAHAGTQEYPVKLLLSHDPSHWRGQVLPQYKDIDVAFAGHTHGMQYGVELGSFKWSPVQLRYKEWAGLYEENDQKLYVNRGFGYIGYPGRVGIYPEITIFELKSA